MTPLEFVLLLLFTFLVVVVVVGGVAVVAASRAATEVASALSTRTSGQGVTIHDVEAYLDSLAHEPHVDTAVVSEVVPETRRPGQWPLALARDPRDGVRIDATVPTPQRQLASEWFALPHTLDGRSRFERLLDAHGVPMQDLSDLLGCEIHVEKEGDAWRFVLQDEPRAPVEWTLERLRSMR